MALQAATPFAPAFSSNSRIKFQLKTARLPIIPYARPFLSLFCASSSNLPRFSGCTKAFSSADGFLEPSESADVVCFGEMLIDFVPTVSGLSLSEAPAFKKAPGGAPANVAVGIARLGGSAAFVGKVGEDEFGYMLADILKENSVNNSGLRFDPGARTALAFVTLRSDGEREFMFYRNPSADMLLKEEELDLELIRKAKIFHYGSISLITEPCRSAHVAAAKAAKEAGVLLSYDPNLRLPLWSSADSAREGILSIWDIADIIKISEEEISFLTRGEDPYDDAVVRKLFHPNLKLLLVTEGSEGCRYYSKEFSGRVPGIKVSAVDTTGAGDAFVAGILSQLALDQSLIKDEVRLREALKFANACGALTVTERGAIPALPTRQAVLDALVNVPA
ncbi:putative fructokinase-6 [Carex littledalei]|uniref:fructokinase n=1 Tax=Carex littledalei TaxID=544730 RepID=A0A833R343_9POAL|nr:putative fructokinase-6 [Carex littledalei]